MTAYTSTKNILPEGPNYAEGDTLTLANGSTWYYTECDSWQWMDDAASSIVAAGSTQSNATALAEGFNIVTAANGAKGVRLPTAAEKKVVTVINTVADQTLLVYPATGGQINALGANAAFSLQAGQTASFAATSATQWYVSSASAVSYTTITATTVNATTLDTNVAAAGVTLSGTTLAADGTDTNIDININPKGSGDLVTPALTVGKAGTASGVITMAGTTSGSATLTVADDGSTITANKPIVAAVNGTVGATTPAAVAATTITGTSSATLGAVGGAVGSIVLLGSTSGTVTVNTDATATALLVDKALTVTGRTTLTGNVANTAGAGITGGVGTVCKTAVTKEGDLFITRIFVDLTGLNCGGTAGDIIGKDGTAASHLGQITAAVNGTIVGATMQCFETPTGGDTDIDIYSATESTGAEDAAVSGLTAATQIVNGGAQTAGTVTGSSAVPPANSYLYLVGQGTGDTTYTAGQLLITLIGV